MRKRIARAGYQGENRRSTTMRAFPNKPTTLVVMDVPPLVDFHEVPEELEPTQVLPDSNESMFEVVYERRQ